MIQNYEFLKYGNLNYSVIGITPKIQEISCTFNNFNNVSKLYLSNYSLHTEYSASPIKNPYLQNYPSLFNSTFNGKASLWTSNNWVKEFFDLIDQKIQQIGKAPTIIEIHPPYKKHVKINDFFNRYTIFENIVLKKYPDVMILIENRNCCGNFLLSRANDYIDFANQINDRKLNLKLIIDIPQLFGKELFLNKNNNVQNTIDNVFYTLSTRIVADNICGIHICGKGHNGGFDSIFNKNIQNTQYFLNRFKAFSLLLTNKIYIVPEIFKQQDFVNIINDLKNNQIL